MMKDKRGKCLLRVAGGAVILLFAVLLMVRLDIPEKFRIRAKVPLRLMQTQASEDVWLEIRQKGIKIGYVHRKRKISPEGIAFSEKISMRIHTMGVTQPLSVTTSAHFNRDGEIRDFAFFIASHLFPFQAEGTVQDGKMIVRIGSERKVVDWPQGVYLGTDAMAAAGLAGIAPGEKRSLFLFDPATLAARPVTVEAMGDECLTVMGESVAAKKLAFDVMGMRQFAWISSDGSVLREEGLLGMSLERVSMQVALSGVDQALLPDLTEAASIPVSTPIKNPQAVTELALRMNGLPEGRFLLDGDRQTWKGGILTIRLENLLQGNHRKKPENLHAFLEAAPFIQSDNPLIVRKVSDIVSKQDSGKRTGEKLVSWLYKNIAKKPVLSIPDAHQTLKSGEGDCNEHAALLAAMARAAGLPAQIETGLVWMSGRFFYHAWNVLYIDEYGGWVTADAALGQFPADATHIRFSRGGMENQADLAGLMGRLEIDIVRMKP